MTGVPGGLAPATGSLRLAAQHFAAATIYLLAGAAGLVWVAPDLAAGAFLGPRVAGVTHLVTLGWLTTMVFGALCQLLPVALGAPIRWPRVADAGFWLYAPGVGVFAVGVATADGRVRLGGLVLVTTGLLAILANLAASLARGTTRDETRLGLVLSLGFLVLTLGFGIALVHNLETGFAAAARTRLLAAHLHLAAAGWILMTIVGVSHRLLPMFFLAHGADTRGTRPALALLAAGVSTLAVGLLLGRPGASWAGAALLAGGVLAFLWQVRAFHRARVRRRLDAGLRFAVVALAFLAAAIPLGSAALLAGANRPRLPTAYVALGVLGGLVLYVVGFAYKIVPLLAWTGRYRGRMGREPVPTVAQLYSSRLADVQLGLMAAGVVVLVAGVATGAGPAAQAGAGLFAAGTAVFAAQLAGVAAGRVVPASPGRPA